MLIEEILELHQIVTRYVDVKRIDQIVFRIHPTIYAKIGNQIKKTFSGLEISENSLMYDLSTSETIFGDSSYALFLANEIGIKVKNINYHE